MLWGPLFVCFCFFVHCIVCHSSNDGLINSLICSKISSSKNIGMVCCNYANYTVRWRGEKIEANLWRKEFTSVTITGPHFSNFFASSNPLSRNLFIYRWCSDWKTRWTYDNYLRIFVLLRCMRTTMCCRNIGPSYYIYASRHLYIVFDHTIRLYNAEIWGTCNIHSLRLQKSNILILNDCYKDLLCETLHFNFSKYILGVCS